jgi:hypothetical protein
MKKQLKKKLFAQSKRLGRDWDGDMIKYRGKYYVYNILANKAKEVKDIKSKK